MHIRLPLKIALSLLLAGCFASAHAAPPDLAQLTFAGATKKQIIHIPAKAGKYTPKNKVSAQASWFLVAGEALKAGTQPAEQVIRLYRTAGSTRALLCTIAVKYFPANGKWLPRYRMEENLMLARTGERLVPMPTGMGEPDLNLMVGTLLPNVEGYYDRIEFGLPLTSVAIDYLEVQ